MTARHRLVTLLDVNIFPWFSQKFARPNREARELFIASYEFPLGLQQRFAQSHPTLKHNDCTQVFDALKTYFWICGRNKNGMASMPSQIVDDAWHEFILWTREYSMFCEKAFGFFLHHTPAQAMTSPTQAQDGIQRTWRLACLHDEIDPRNPQRLPLLFALDAQLNIANGFYYSLNCLAKPQNRNDYCATHIGCGSGCDGDTSDSNNDSHSDSGDAGSDGGGGSCGGGCGGGD